MKKLAACESLQLKEAFNGTQESHLHQGRSWVLFPFPDWDSKPKFRLSGVALSRVGCELLRIVDQDPMPEYTEDLKKFFAGQNLKMTEVNNQ